VSKPRDYIEIVVRTYPSEMTEERLKRERDEAHWFAKGVAEDRDYRRPRVVSVKAVRPKPPTKLEREMVKKARVPRARQQPCFSCVDKDARYADGLCEACHRIATDESDRMKGAKP
jgi:hypothetical protein